MTYYFLESRLNNKPAQIVGHSQNEETGEIYYKFLDMGKCKKLMKDEMKVSPEYEYRINKIIQRIEIGKWEKANSDKDDERSVATEAERS